MRSICHVCISCHIEHPAVFVVLKVAKDVGHHPICAFYKNGFAVDDKLPIVPALQNAGPRRARSFYPAHARLEGDCVDLRLAVFYEGNFCVVQMRLAHSVRPPKSGIFDLEIGLEPVAPLVHFEGKNFFEQNAACVREFHAETEFIVCRTDVVDGSSAIKNGVFPDMRLVFRRMKIGENFNFQRKRRRIVRQRFCAQKRPFHMDMRKKFYARAVPHSE